MNWVFSNMFRRRPPPKDCREWNEDWQAGDLAECVCDCFTPSDPGDPKRGQTLRVAGVVEGPIIGENAIAVGLEFQGKCHAYKCTGFRKLRPTLTPATIEFTAFLRNALRRLERVR